MTTFQRGRLPSPRRQRSPPHRSVKIQGGHKMKAFLLATISALACCAAQAGEVTVATVNNPDMITMQKLAPQFTKSHPGITVKFVVLPDDNAGCPYLGRHQEICLQDQQSIGA